MGNPDKIPGNLCCGGLESNRNSSCACTQSPSKPTPWIVGLINTPAGLIPQITTRLTFQDILGTWRVRWNIGRMNYQVSPGLYAVGNPDASSPVLVSANYKMSFDRLRKELDGLDLWVLVLDTKGINVWCAAGKGTFGTKELVDRIATVRLKEIVSHRKIILPQLGAPGVSAHEVFKLSGFKVFYGPIRSRDIPRYLQAGMKATPAMREVQFGIIDRLVLTPVELVALLKPGLILLGFLFVINAIFHFTEPFFGLLSRSIFDFIPYLGAGILGAVIVPVLLPYIPGRAFSLKGWFMGLIWAIIYLWFISPVAHWITAATYLLLLPPIVSYLAMNFTGSTTFTSLSGVLSEMKIAVPAQIISAGCGILFMIGNLFI